MPSREVQLGFVLSVQPPLEEVLIPAAAMREAACAWVSLVPERSSRGVARTAETVATRAMTEVNCDDVSLTLGRSESGRPSCWG